MWKQEKINLGKIPVKKPVEIEFEYQGDGVFKGATSTCGCTTPKWDIDKSVLLVTYTPKDIPQHLKMAGNTEYSSDKYVHVNMFENDSIKKYSLSINAKVFKV